MWLSIPMTTFFKFCSSPELGFLKIITINNALHNIPKTNSIHKKQKQRVLRIFSVNE